MQLDPESLKKLEQDLQVKNEETAKKMKEIEMQRTHQQYTNNCSHITSPAMGRQFSDGLKYLPHTKHSYTDTPTTTENNTQSVFKVPPPVTPKVHATKPINCENSAPMGGSKSATNATGSVGNVGGGNRRAAFGESTNQQAS